MNQTGRDTNHLFCTQELILKIKTNFILVVTTTGQLCGVWSQWMDLCISTLAVTIKLKLIMYNCGSYIFIEWSWIYHAKAVQMVSAARCTMASATVQCLASITKCSSGSSCNTQEYCSGELCILFCAHCVYMPPPTLQRRY